MKKNWTGNKNSTFSALGASNHSNHEREKHDFYATDPNAIDSLFAVHEFSKKIYEPACGMGHLSIRMSARGKEVKSTDLIYRGIGEGGVDFLHDEIEPIDYDIITNPPYKYAQDFVEKSLEIVQEGNQVTMFLKLTFLEGQKRRKFFDKYPPKNIYVFSKRSQCAINGDEEMFKKSSAACYAWFVWEKGVTTKPIIDWI